MPFYRYFAKNNAQGIVLNDTSSQITFDSGHTLPINVSSGDFLITLGGSGGEIVKVTSASQDASGILTVDVERGQEESSYIDSSSGTIGHLYLTAGMFNKAFNILEENDIKLLKIDITGSVNLDQIEADTTTNNAKVSNVTHTGDVTGADVLGIVPAAISDKTGVTPVAGDYVLLWDATDSALKKVDVTNFLNLVTSVNGLSGVVNLVTGDISDTISTQKYTTAANLTKIGYISVTQPVDLDTMESNITTNNAKITNANHTGDVTGADVLGIVPAAISGKTGVTPVSGDYMLLWDATDSLLKKVDASNFLNGGVSSVNGFTGAVTLVTGNISDTTSTQKYTTAANLTKIGFIDVTSSIDLNTLSAAVTLNTAKVTNADHTGDVTGSAGLVIVPSAISGKTGVTAVSGDYVLLWDATDSALKKANVSDFIGGGAVDSVNGFTGVVTLVTGNISDTTSTQKYTTAADITKMGYISVTQAVDLDTMESNIATNNAKVTNATHTGDVTGADVLGIVPAAISGKTGETPVAGDYVMFWDATDSLLKKADVTTFINGSYGDVTGPASATNTGIAIYNGTGGKTLMSSLVTIDTSSVTIPGFLTVTAQARYSTQTTLATSGSITWNINNEPKGKIALAGNVTTLTISGININSEATLFVTQDAASAYTITWPGTVIWAGGTAPDISALSSKHIISFYSHDGTNLFAAHVSDATGTMVTSVNGSSGAVTLVTGNISDTTSTQKYTTAADITKLGYISVTQPVDLDTMETNITTNNAKVTNADHTGDVTGSTGLVITPTAISGKTEVTPATGDYVLLWDFTDSTLKKSLVDTFISAGGGGDVTGPGASTSTAVAVYNSTDGKLIKNTGVLIDASNNITGITALTATGTVTAESGMQIGTSSVAAARYLDLYTDASNRKGIRFYKGTGAKWVIQSDTDHSFKILRYDTTLGTFVAYDFIINEATGAITTSGTINGRNLASDGTSLDNITTSTQTLTNKRITKRVTTLTDAATIAINCDNMDMGKVTLTASRTLGTPTGTPTDGQPLLLEVIQGGTGSYTLTAESVITAGSYRFGSDVASFTLSTAVGKKDLILLTYLSDMTGWAVASISKGYPA